MESYRENDGCVLVFILQGKRDRDSLTSEEKSYQEERKWFHYLWNNENVPCNNARLSRKINNYKITCLHFPSSSALISCILNDFNKNWCKSDFFSFLFWSNGSFQNPLFSRWFLHYLAVGNIYMGWMERRKEGSSSFLFLWFLLFMFL